MPNNRIHWYSDTLTPGVKAFPVVLERGLQAVMEYEANNCQNDMRHKAPWTDRTGNARQGLFARAGSTATSKFIVLYHTVPYGIWLEVRHDGAYAIILPTIEADGPKVMKSVSRVLDKLS